MTLGARRVAPLYLETQMPAGEIAVDETTPAVAEEELSWIEPAAELPAEPRWPAGLLIAAALLWIGVSAWGTVLALSGRVASVPVIVSWISVGCGPLALLGIGYLLWRRSPRREVARFGGSVATIQGETLRLESLLARINTRIEAQSAAIAGQADALAALGERTGGRLDQIGTQLKSGTAELGRQATALDEAAERAKTDIGILLGDLPEAEQRVKQIAAAIRETEDNAQQGATRLETALAQLAQRAGAAGDAGQKGAAGLAAVLHEIEALTQSSEERVAAHAARVSEALEFSLRQAAEAFEQTRAGIDQQSAAMLAMVDQGQVALGQAGVRAAAELGERIEAVVAQLDTLGDRLAIHDQDNSTVFARITRHLVELETRYVVIGESGLAKTGQLDGALAALRGEIEQLTNSMAAGDLAASVTLKRAETLRQQLDACLDGIDIRIPDALERVEARAVQSQRVVDEALPKVEALIGGADAVASRLAAADGALDRQVATLGAYFAKVEECVAAARGNAEELAGAIGEIEGRTRDLSEGSAARLVETMIRVRETAMQAAQRAEEAIAAIVPKAAASLGDASRSAIEGAIAAEVEGKVARIGEAGARAVEVIEQSNADLLRQLKVMVDTTSAIEVRLEESRKRLAKSDADSFGRRMALLIEALKSTAIDVTAVLSTEVSDTAWEAYLKGDRGVFARRAVRLIDGGAVKQIGQLYEADYAFRDQVNRYIHDFEAMLRDVLANRDGTPLGVTLLSSDAGKLYVALAQGIERLRG
ncbi:hypothetical protein [Sphingomonas sp. ID0503]|uniref:hypothetical protein n=1 Tax=Sphingomonas sp. ID0503 TaxID=3399691 RepID=UPI003AFAADE8